MPSSFDAAISALAHDENLTRVKKLLIYACKSVWESEPYRLEYFDLRSLVMELLQLAPSQQQLRTRLDTFVRTLSKADEYTLIAELIYTHLQPLCAATAPAVVSTQQAIYQTLASQLLQEPEQVRIKKLIYCACTHVWENNPEALSQMNLADLLEHLHQQNLAPQTLSDTLSGVVQSLNRQAQYIPIAQRVEAVLLPLYQPEAAEQTHVLTGATSNFTEPAPSSSDTQLNAPVGSPLPRPLPLPPPPPPPPRPPTHLLRQAKPLDLANLMDVRLDVMKYSNPLRTKALLFAVVYRPLGSDFRTWLVLRDHTLDVLLQQVFQSFQSYGALEANLGRVANSLADPEIYTQAAGAVLQALKLYYPEEGRSPAPGDSDSTTREGPNRYDLTLPKEYH